MSAAYSLSGKKIFVTGHRGMVGSALVRRLSRENCEILTVSRQALDLRQQPAVAAWMRDRRPDVVIIAAARVGGILANVSYPAEFLYDNLMIQTNLIHSAFEVGVEKLLFLGSSCIYPKFAEQPITENSLLTGPLERTNQWYAVAKIAGLKMCEAYRKQYGVDFVSAMPTNLYGIGDNFEKKSSHVLPALIRNAHEARSAGRNDLEIWGTGTPLREFLFADDCADALAFILMNYSEDEIINVGSGSEVSIAELARMVMKTVGLTGDLTFDLNKPDGTPRKLMSSQKLANLGWRPKVNLTTGIQTTFEWYLANVVNSGKIELLSLQD